MSVIDCGREVPLIASNSWSSRRCNSSGDNISTSEEAGIKMATDEELGADKAYTIGSFLRLWNRKFSSHMSQSEQMYMAKIATEMPAETFVLGETVGSLKPSSCWHKLMRLSRRTKIPT